MLKFFQKQFKMTQDYEYQVSYQSIKERQDDFLLNDVVEDFIKRYLDPKDLEDSIKKWKGDLDEQLNITKNPNADPKQIAKDKASIIDNKFNNL